MASDSGFDSSIDDDLEERLSAAESAVAELAESFTGWVSDDLARARALQERVKSGEGGKPETAEIFSICHNIKGQAGSFGYDLMTQIGAQLCDYLRVLGDDERPRTEIVDGHLLALEFIVKRDVRGDGGPVGQQLLQKLARLGADPG